MHNDPYTLLDRIRRSVGQVIRGKDEVIERVLIGVLAGGHVLLEDVPGVGKTTLAKALARTFVLDFARVQFTPDLLPADILGSQVLRPADGTFSFHRGPLFTNVLLADEINRASPRTQSALLEAMNEGQATVDGVTHPLPRPFFVLATQNPADCQGTYPLPEAQLDRFLMRIGIGYPSPDQELAMLFAHRNAAPVDAVEPIADGDQLLAMQEQVRAVEVKEPVARYLLAIVEATRQHADLEIGVSPRGALALFRAAQARALLSHRTYVSPEDVQALVDPVLAHRVLPTAQARYGGVSTASVLESIVGNIVVPK